MPDRSILQFARTYQLFLSSQGFLGACNIHHVRYVAFISRAGLAYLERRSPPGLMIGPILLLMKGRRRHCCIHVVLLLSGFSSPSLCSFCCPLISMQERGGGRRRRRSYSHDSDRKRETTSACLFPFPFPFGFLPTFFFLDQKTTTSSSSSLSRRVVYWPLSLLLPLSPCSISNLFFPRPSSYGGEEKRRRKRRRRRRRRRRSTRSINHRKKEDGITEKIRHLLTGEALRLS